MVALQIVGLVLAGLLAGEEFIVRYGVQPALRSLDDRSHIGARVALVRSLRIVVPALMLPTVLCAVAVLVAGGAGPGASLRWAGTGALVAFVLISFLGTVPINMKVVDWRADAPPPDWRATVLRWERLDGARSAAAIVAFVCFVAALAVQA
ncbi:DUF1772 domain-containing protein [Cryptosporangium arvum]|uniref:DUF1772 domain-containing protein n=1 Tax=Cryptosporangium arvum TaxID=80871 RepID=UPI0004B89CAD|nr:DUF1772 domain-containing protein [Cryptosporangium arvum]